LKVEATSHLPQSFGIAILLHPSYTAATWILATASSDKATYYLNEILFDCSDKRIIKACQTSQDRL
jgi:hypothetical protein